MILRRRLETFHRLIEDELESVVVVVVVVGYGLPKGKQGGAFARPGKSKF